MSLLPIATIPQPPRFESPAGPFFYAMHDGKKVIQRGALPTGRLNTGSRLICASTSEEVDAEITRLGLTPLARTPRQRAADYFATLAADVQTQFTAVFQAVSAIPKDADAALAVEAVTVPDDLQPVKTQILALLRGQQVD